MIQRIASIFILGYGMFACAERCMRKRTPFLQGHAGIDPVQWKTIPLNKTVNPLPADPENLEKGRPFISSIACYATAIYSMGRGFADRFSASGEFHP